MYQELYVIDVPIHSISATHTITEEDLGLTPGTLPPEELATLGNLKLVAKDKLAPGETLRARANRLLSSVGVKAGPGRFVTESVLKPTIAKLEDMKNEFYAWKSEFIAELPAHIEQRKADNPEFAHLLSQYAPDITRVERRLSFDIDVYKIDIPKADPNSQILSDTLSRDGNNISKRLIAEIVEFVDKAHKGSIQKSQKLVKQNMGPLRNTLLPKIQSFQLLDSSLVAVSSHLESFITDVLAAIDSQPKGKPYLDGSVLQPFEARLNQLRSVASIEALISNAPKANAFVTSSKPSEEPEVQPTAAPPSIGSLPKRSGQPPTSSGVLRPRSVAF